MSLVISTPMLQAVLQLAYGQLPHDVSEIRSAEDAIVSLASRRPEHREEALKYLREANQEGHVPWGSLTPFLVFYYHFLFVNEDRESVDELRKLIQNSMRRSQLSTSDRQLFEVLTRADEFRRNFPRET